MLIGSTKHIATDVTLTFFLHNEDIYCFILLHKYNALFLFIGMYIYVFDTHRFEPSDKYSY